MAELAKKYRAKGLKITPQRLAILEFLDGNTDHPSAESIFEGVKENFPTISFATVYNTLEALKRTASVQEITIDPERKHYDPNMKPHHHIVCISCNRIDDVFADYGSSLKLPDEVGDNFKLVGEHVNFYGVCGECDGKSSE